MKIRSVSDLHLEFLNSAEEVSEMAETILPTLPDDRSSVLLLCGDICSANRHDYLKAFLDKIADRFSLTLYIPGNHEYYHGNYDTTPTAIIEEVPAFVIFQRDASILSPQGVKFHMHTLWTDFDKESPDSMNEARYRMNDYRLIYKGKYRLTPEDTLEFHKKHLEALERDLNEGDVVMTHHSPSLRSVPAEYLTDRVNGAYHSDLEGLILRKKPKLWVHGHTHTACDYMIGDTHVVCNPRGYGNQFRKNGYRADLVLEV